MPTPPLSPSRTVGDLVFLSGIVPRDPLTGATVTGDVTEQSHAVLSILRNNLIAAGSSLADVQRVGVYLADLDDFDAFNEVYRMYFSEPFPARTAIGAALRGIRVEVDAIAVRSESVTPS
jgi:2-iminobutanoate/2-iminopropanoate deaminase